MTVNKSKVLLFFFSVRALQNSELSLGLPFSQIMATSHFAYMSMELRGEIKVEDINWEVIPCPQVKPPRKERGDKEVPRSDLRPFII